MKKLMVTLLVVGMVGAASTAFADVSKLTLRFGGGCTSTNTGNCTLKVTADGSDLDSETFLIKTAPTAAGPFVKSSNRLHSLDVNGRGSMHVKNAGGCFRAYTGPNGNDKPDRKSNIKCE